MRIRIQRHGLMPAVLVTVVGVLALYLASTWGWAQLQATRTSTSSGIGTLPQVVERAPSSVATTGDYGPLGSVSMSYAGTEVREGLLGELDPVWLMVSSQTGDTRALSAEGLPEPGAGALSVSPAGDRLAWVDDSSATIYDTATDETRALGATDVDAVGAFSPSGAQLLAYADGTIVVLDLDSGDVVSRFDAEPEALRRAVWRDDSTVDFVDGGELVTGSVTDSSVSRQPTDIPERSQLAWSKNRLASLQPTSTVRRLFVSEVGDDGSVGPSRRIDTPQIALERLLGSSGGDTVAVLAYALESGAVPRVLDVPLDGGSTSDVSTLPDPGENWVGVGTVAVATDTLPFGSTDFEEHVWPWSYAARLAGCALLGLFLLGLFVTRRPRT